MKKSQTTISRRNLVKTLGSGVALAAGAVVVAAQSTSTQAARIAAPGKKSVQYGMLIDTRRCSGCHACSVACKSEFNVPLGLTRSWVEYVEKGDYPDVRRGFLPRLCNHCRHPACVDVCPTGATYKRKEDGIVVVDADVCIGCKYCMQACPYDARFINPTTGTADKCDFCLHRVSQGVAPSCVNTCQGRARIFGDVNDPDSEIARLINTNPVTVLRPGQGTEPMVFYIDAEHAGEHDRARGWYVDVTTHRKQQERR